MRAFWTCSNAEGQLDGGAIHLECFDWSLDLSLAPRQAYIFGLGCDRSLESTEYYLHVLVVSDIPAF